MMKHVHNTSQSRSLYKDDRSLRGSDLSLTCSSLSEDSVTILEERPRADMEHGRLARHVWDRYTSSSDLGLGKHKTDREVIDDGDGKKMPSKDQVFSKKEEKVSTADSTNTASGIILLLIC